VVEQIGLDNPAELKVLIMVGNQLVETLAEEGVVLRGLKLAVVLRLAAHGSATMRSPWPVVHIEGVAQRKFIVDLVIQPE
jgi:hypothetical protein